MESPEERGQGEREREREREQGVVIGQGQRRSPKMQEAKERTKGQESLWLLEAPVRKMIRQMHTPAHTSQCWSRQTHGLGVCIWMHLVNSTCNSPSPGLPTPGVVKQDKSSRGSTDTTRTMASCQPPPLALFHPFPPSRPSSLAPAQMAACLKASLVEGAAPPCGYRRGGP